MPEFTYYGDTRAYLNLGKEPKVEDVRKLLTLFESVSKWKDHKGPEGQSIFKDSYTANFRFREIADQIDGEATYDGDSRYAVLKAKAKSITIRVDGQLTMYKLVGGGYEVQFLNIRPIRASIAGKIIDSKGLELKIYVFPYKNGWLMHGYARVLLEKFEDDFDPETASNLVSGFFRWLEGQLTEPLEL